MRSSKSVFVRYCARVLMLMLGLGAAPLACLAATIFVTTTGDAGGAGGCTVRQAIATINNGAGPDANTGNCSIASGTLGTDDTILFDLATFPNGGGNTITLADASTSTLSIYAANLTIDATANGQVAIQRPSGAANKFGIMGDSTAGSLTLNHLTLSNGAGGVCAGAFGGGGGIGICVSGVNLTLNNCTLSGNSADNRGGGIWSAHGSVTLNNSTLSGNSASGGDGGGILASFGPVSLTDSTLNGNSAPNGAGGGIEVLTGSLTLTNSTLSSNQASYGGGIYSNVSTITLINSTVSGNSSSGPGGAGGIVTSASGDTLTLTNSTISANTGGYYGGIFASPGSTSVINSIVAGNSGSYADQLPPNFSSSGSITNGDPRLRALADNGGPTPTMMPLYGSPVLDAIACTNAPATDQRGVARPQGAQCDIGAVEATMLDLPMPPTILKAFGVMTLPVEGTTSLTFTLANPNVDGPPPGISLTGVAFTDSLPAGMVVATPNGLTNTCGGTVTAVAGTSSAGVSGVTLAGGASCTLSIGVKVTTSGAKDNSVHATSINGGTGNTSNATLTVMEAPAITKVFGAAAIALNGSTSLTFTVSNPNASASLTGVGFTDFLPAGMVVATPNGLTSNCGGTAIAAAGASGAFLSGATLAGGASCTMVVNVQGTTFGTKNNSVQVVSNEGGFGNTSNAMLTVALCGSGGDTVFCNGFEGVSNGPLASGLDFRDAVALDDAGNVIGEEWGRR